jgi:hypothetical protein
MRRVMFAASVALMIPGTIGFLADRSLAVPLSDFQVYTLATAGRDIQDVAYICHRWWQWHGARWVRSCWPAGHDPCWNAPGCSPPTWYRPSWQGWGWPYWYWP